MTDERDESPLDPRLIEQARSYNAPPAADHDAMWRAIEARRRPAGSRRQAPRDRRLSRGSRRPVLNTRVAAWITGIAALLVLGIGIGRMTAGGGVTVSSPTTVAVEASSGPSRALEIAAAQHLNQAETYLTLFRASVRSGEVDSLPVAAARQLLSTNRLLLDSPVADARLRPLLLDLELVLAEISQLGTTSRATDVQLITDGLDHGDVITRLRVSPARSSLPLGVL